MTTAEKIKGVLVRTRFFGVFSQRDWERLEAREADPERVAAPRASPTDLPFPLSYSIQRETWMRQGRLPPDLYRSSLPARERRRLYLRIVCLCLPSAAMQYSFVHWLEPHLGLGLTPAVRAAAAAALAAPFVALCLRGVRNERANFGPLGMAVLLGTLTATVIGFVHGFDWVYHALTGHFPPDIA